MDPRVHNITEGDVLEVGVGVIPKDHSNGLSSFAEVRLVDADVESGVSCGKTRHKNCHLVVLIGREDVRDAVLDFVDAGTEGSPPVEVSSEIADS